MQEDEYGSSVTEMSAYLDRGWDLLGRGDLLGARASAQRSLELDDASPEAHYLMGYIDAAAGAPSDALEHYEQAIALDETFFEAMLSAAEVLIHSMGDAQQALRFIEDALELADTKEETADALLMKIDALLSAGDQAAAKRVLASLPKVPSDNISLDFLVARARFETGELEGTEELLRSCIERESSLADAHYYLGLTLDAKQDPRGATVSFLQARELDLRQPRVPWSMTTELFEKQVQGVIQKIAGHLRGAMDGALVMVVDAPGAEVVADGVDPRATVLLDALGPIEAPPQVGRIFVYQRNVERAVGSAEAVQDELVASIERELVTAYPTLAQS